MRYQFHRKFKKSYQKADKRLQTAVDDRLKIFASVPFSSILNNHALIGKYLGYRSINVTGDYRAIYKVISDDEVIFIILDTHSNLY